MADQTTMALEELTAALNDCALGTIPVNNNNDLNRRLQQIRTILTPRPAPAPAAAAPRVARRHTLPPRVNKHHEPAPRVLRPRVLVYAQTSTRGTRVYKMFDGPRERSVCHQETIVNFDSRNVGYYKVRSEGGDTEEYDVEQIRVMLHKPNYTNIVQALSATRHE